MSASVSLRALALSLVVSAAASGVASCSPAPSDASRAGASTAKAPEFSTELLGGESFRLGDHLGKNVIVLDFWTTFCQPCIGVLQHLNDLHKKHKDKGLVVLAVAMDPPDTAGQVMPFVRSHNLQMPITHDVNSRITELYNKKSLAPYQVLIGRDGRILKQRDSYQPGDEAGMEHDIEVALQGK